MKFHSCKICRSPHRQTIEDWRFKDGLKLEEILSRATNELGFALSLGTVSKHLAYVGAEMTQIIEDQMREVVRDKGQLAASAPANNIELCNQLIARLVRVDNEGNPIVLPMADDFLVDLLRERRQSAALILQRPADSAATDALSTFTDLMKRAAEADREDDEPECV